MSADQLIKDARAMTRRSSLNYDAVYHGLVEILTAVTVSPDEEDWVKALENSAAELDIDPLLLRSELKPQGHEIAELLSRLGRKAYSPEEVLSLVEDFIDEGYRRGQVTLADYLTAQLGPELRKLANCSEPILFIDFDDYSSLVPRVLQSCGDNVDLADVVSLSARQEDTELLKQYLALAGHAPATILEAVQFWDVDARSTGSPPNILGGRQFGTILVNHLSVSTRTKPGQLTEIERWLPALLKDQLAADGRVILLAPPNVLDARDSVTFREQLTGQLQLDAVVALTTAVDEGLQPEMAALLLLRRPQEAITRRVTVLAPRDLQAKHPPAATLTQVSAQVNSDKPPEDEAVVFERPTSELVNRWDPKFYCPARQKLQDRLIDNPEVRWLESITELIAQGRGPGRLIPFIRTRLAGVTMEGRQESLASLRVGDKVWLKREPDNAFDPNAIRVERRSGIHLGYVPAELAAELAPGLDQIEGTHEATVTNVHGGTVGRPNRGATIEFPPLFDPDSLERRLTVVQPEEPGRRSRSGSGRNAPPIAQPIVMVRPHDISTNKLTGPGERVLLVLNNPFLAAQKRAAWETSKVRLKGNDILLQVDQPDKACIVTAGYEGAICHEDLAVLRPSRDVDPLYLLTYILGSEFQQQLQFVMRSNGRRHVDLEDLRELLVTVPPLARQRRIAMAFAESQGELGAEVSDGLAESLRVATEPGTEELTWLVSSLLSNLTSDMEQIGTLNEWLHTKGRYVRQLRNVVLHDRAAFGDAELAGAILKLALFRDAVEHFFAETTGQEGISTASQLLNEFRSAVSRVGDLYTRGQLSDLAWRLEQLIRIGLTTTSLDFSLESAVLPVDMVTSLRLRVSNPGTEPITDLSIFPALSSGEIVERPDWVLDYLGPGETRFLEARVRFNIPGSIRLSGTSRLVVGAARRVEQLPTLRLEAAALDQLPFSPIQPNPYITGGAVESREMFFGREDVLAFLRDSLLGAHQNNVIILQGNRRTGKTSILKQIVVRDWFAPHIPVFIDCQGMGRLSNQLFYYKVAKEIWKALSKRSDVETPRAVDRSDISDDDPFYDFRELLDDLIPPGRKLILLIDEFEIIDMAIQRKDLDVLVLENLRHLFQHNRNLAIILTGSYRLSSLSAEYWSILFGLGLKRNIGFLEESASRQLITQPLQELVTFSKEAVDRIIALTSCQPLFVQMICHNIVNLLNSRRSNYVSLQTVEDAAQETLTSASEQMRHMLTGTESPVMQAVLVFVANRLLEVGETVPFGEIERFTRQNKLPVAAGHLTESLRELEQRDLLAISGSASRRRYSFKIDLFRQWLRRNQDLETAISRARDAA